MKKGRKVSSKSSGNIFNWKLFLIILVVIVAIVVIVMVVRNKGEPSLSPPASGTTTCPDANRGSAACYTYNHHKDNFYVYYNKLSGPLNVTSFLEYGGSYQDLTSCSATRVYCQSQVDSLAVVIRDKYGNKDCIDSAKKPMRDGEFIGGKCSCPKDYFLWTDGNCYTNPDYPSTIPVTVITNEKDAEKTIEQLANYFQSSLYTTISTHENEKLDSSNFQNLANQYWPDVCFDPEKGQFWDCTKTFGGSSAMGSPISAFDLKSIVYDNAHQSQYFTTHIAVTVYDDHGVVIWCDTYNDGQHPQFGSTRTPVGKFYPDIVVGGSSKGRFGSRYVADSNGNLVLKDCFSLDSGPICKYYQYCGTPGIDPNAKWCTNSDLVEKERITNGVGNIIHNYYGDGGVNFIFSDWAAKNPSTQSELGKKYGELSKAFCGAAF